jgi:hypothetical protein
MSNPWDQPRDYTRRGATIAVICLILATLYGVCIGKGWIKAPCDGPACPKPTPTVSTR